ncbi:methyltransferase [Pararhizobium sp.]|uniref:methyltransferase n=1 Tax=Pararhizobium sp. TaxID=1977563 RepID=UPI002725D9D4|nr:methyltransferase [Pararhizobium sp.]MDO9416292.1 methyltransferase domain-containing protein [Pararhizobium sp.]
MNQLSSGDMLADRRADYARMLAESGEPASAAELMTQALEIVPGWAAGWFQLATYEEKSGSTEAAVAALQQVLVLSPGDQFGAGLKLAVLGAAAMPALPPSRYVEQLFDDYAGRFDGALVERLGYTVPEKLAALVHGHAGIDHHFAHVTDLGCGTGLFGERIKANAGFLEGFDLSANMLAKARDKPLYDRLAQADLSLAPAVSGVFTEGLDPMRADLVAAADVLMYLGDLGGVLAIAAELISDGGIFAFSVEDAGNVAGFVLRPSLRYAHSENYVRELLGSHSFILHEMVKTVIRKDGGEPVHGILFLARKAG